MTLEELQAENERLRSKLSPLEDKKFTEELRRKLAHHDLTPYTQKLRRGAYIVVTPAQIGELCFGEAPNTRTATNIGRSLQALCWERSALHGHLVFVMPVEEYEHERP